MSRSESHRDLGRWMLLGGAVLLFVWIAFFDSHSLLKRVRWYHEYEQIATENEQLQEEIDALQQQLEQPLSDELVERIAREQYGMRYPDETVYPTDEQ